MSIKKYPSKISYTLLIFVFLVMYVPVIYSLNKGERDNEMMVYVVIITLIYLPLLYLFFNTAYIINDDKLIIKVGFYSFKPIDISTIKKIEKTKSLLASPATSFDRIWLSYGKYDDVILSPKNKIEFIMDLKQINPNIKEKITGK
jgi:hypothetical protein